MSFNHWKLFDAVSKKVPNRNAILQGETSISYELLNERSRRLATFLLDCGIKAPVPRHQLKDWESGQDHVAIYLYNGKEYIETTFAANAARAVPFNVNYRYVEEELLYLFNDATPKVIVYQAAFAPTLSNILNGLKVKPILLQVADESNNSLIEDAFDYETALTNTVPKSTDQLEQITGTPLPEDLYILYTGGTTGMPKGTIWKQCDIYSASMQVFSARLGIPPSSIELISDTAAKTETSVSLPLPPFMHGASQWTALGTLLAGLTIALPNTVDKLNPQDVWATVEKFRVESMVIVGDAFARPLCEELEKNKYDLSSLIFLATGGAATSQNIKSKILELIPNVLIADIGGSSESGAILSNISRKGSEVTTGSFYPMPGTFVADETLTYLLSPGDQSIGWLVKTHPIPLGYLNDEQKTSRTFPVIETQKMTVLGDRARILSDGRIELLGRDSVTINTGGEKVFAEEVEATLMGHPCIKDTIVVGRPSEKWGQEIVAVVELYPNHELDEKEILEVLSTKLAKYKLPKQIVQVDSVLRSPAGKADYGWAREIAVKFAK